MTSKAYQRLQEAVRPVVEALEARQLLSSTLPFVLDFNSEPTGGLVDGDGQSIGFTHVQANLAGNEYQPGLLDLVTGDGLLYITSAPGSNRDFDNTLVNSLEIEFDGATAGVAITVRLRGPLSQIDAPFEQAGIMFGPDQDNYIKLVAVARSDGQFLQFNDEQTTNNVATHTVDKLQSIGSFDAISSLELRLLADPLSGVVSAEYAVNDGEFTPIAGATLTLAGAKKAEFFSATANAGLVTMHRNTVGPVTVGYDDFEVRHRPSIIGVNPSPGQSGVRRDVFVGADLFLPSGALDPSTVDGTTVKLYKTSTGALVPASVNTSGGGDSIVLQPTNLLDADTGYTFEVFPDVKDVSGIPLLPYKMTFNTGTDGGPPNTNIEFEKVPLPSTSLSANYTSVTMGPDNKLYAGTIDGRIARFPINADGTVGAAEVLNALHVHESGPRLMEGFVFDPASTANNLVVWVTHSFFDFDAAPEWSSKVTRLSGPNLENAHDAVVGLPRSAHNHLTNQPIFGPVEGDGKRYLYFTQAGNTAQGGIDSTWGFRPERLLSAAVLRLDTSAVQPGTTLNVQTEDLGAANYNPWDPDAPLKIYATGLRNTYDIVWTHDGFLYGPNNGSNAGGATPPTPELPIVGSIRIDGDDDGDPSNGHYSNPPVPGINPLGEGQPDFLFRIDQGGYYGHPNPSRAEFVLNGGNPTSGGDPWEIKSYPVGTLPDRNYRPPAFSFGAKYSPNGIIEYRGDAFGGELDGALMVTRYSGGDDVVILKRNPDGSIAEQQTGVTGLTGFADPLDLTQHPDSGYIYVAEYGGKRLTLLRAIAAPGSPPSGITATGTGPTRVVLNWNPVATASTYRIQRKAPGEVNFSDYAAVNGTTFTDTSASALLTYEYRIRAENNGGVSNYSAPVSATTGAPGAWTAGVSLPEATAEAGGDIINGKLYVAGESTPDTWEFDFATGVWTARAIRPFTGDVSNAEHSTHAVNGKLYLIGGLSGGAENKVQIFDPVSNTWTLGADRPWNAGSSPSAVINGQIYVAAGAVTSPSYQAVNRVARYNPVTNTWTELAPMPSPRHATLGATDGQKLWVFGGRDKGLEASDGTNTVQVYDPATNTWTTSDDLSSGLAPIPRPVRGASVTFYNGEFYIFGGENSSGGHGATANKVFHRVDIYNPQTNTWRLGKPMPTARHATVAIPHQDRIYVVGGGVTSGTSFSTGVEVFDVLANPAPSTPVNLVAITISPTEIGLGWEENADNEAVFEIYRSTDGETYELHATVIPNTTTFSDTSVTDGNTYWYKVRAVNATGASAFSNEASAVAGQPQPPAAPTSLTAVPLSTTRIELDWNPSVGATSYRIERQGPGDSGFLLVGTSTQSSFIDQGLTKDSTYTYRVQAVNAAGSSGYSNTAEATTPESTPLISLDINTNVAGSTTVINEGSDYDVIAGGENIWDSADSFRYVYAEVSGDFDVMLQVTAASMDAIKAGIMARESLSADSRHVFSSLSTGNSYRLASRNVTGGTTTNAFRSGSPEVPNVWLRLKRVGDIFTGYYSADGGNWTQMASVTLALPHGIHLGLAVSAQSLTQTGTISFRNFGEVPGTAPSTPTGLAASPFDHTRIDLGWNASPGATRYRMQRRLPGDTFADVALVTATTFSDTGLTPDTTYEYRVIAENEFGASNPSNPVSATTPPAPSAPDAPTGVQATAFSHVQIDLAWNASSGADSYRIERRTAGGQFAQIATGVVETSYSDLNLDPATTYEYRIIAENEIGLSPASEVASATTDPAPTGVPSAPAGLQGSAVSSDEAVLSWNKATGASSYRVQRRLPGGSFADVAFNVRSLSYSDRGLAGSTTYEYRVLGENEFGPSAPSDFISVTTPAPQHTGTDIGNPAAPGSTTPVGSGGDAYDVVGGGSDIAGTADQFHFGHRQLTGDFDMSVNVQSLSQVDLWAKAGLMARASLTPGSRNVFILASTAVNNTHRFTYRALDGADTSSTGSGPAPYPNVWLRLRRVGDTFTGYRSTDGLNWIQVGSATIDLPDTIHFGMAVTGHNTTTAAAAAFRSLAPTSQPSAPSNLVATPASSNVADLKWNPSGGADSYRIERKGPGDISFIEVGTSPTASFRDSGLTPGASYEYRVRGFGDTGFSEYSEPAQITLPGDGTYVGADIGYPATAGSMVNLGGGAFDVTGGGLDIWGNADQLHFVNARLDGDFDIQVQVSSVSLSGAKVGLMARESLDANSRNIFAGMASDDLYRLSRRATTGGSTSNSFKNVAPTLPDVWLRLRRQGTTFRGYYSTDGINWTQMNSISMTLPQVLYVGMAVSARNATQAASVAFRNYTEVPTSPPAAPTDLVANAVSQSQIDLTWTAPAGLNAYVVQRRLAGGTFQEIASGLTEASFSDTGLAPGTTYEYQVLAVNAVGTSGPSNIASATTDPASEVPSAPTGLVGTILTHSEVRLDWNAADGARDYRIQRRAPGGVFVDVATGVVSTTFTDTGLTPGATYEYQVLAENAAGLSDPSNIVSVTMPTAWVYAGSDIGNPALSGSTTRIDDQSYTVTGGGLDIWGKSDQLHFANRQLTGDFDIKVQVTAVSLSQAKAGLMARESLDANSRNVFAGLGVDDAFRLARRTTTGGNTSNVFKSVTPVLPNAWLRLRRVGDVFTGFYSTDGVNWITMGSFTMALPQTVYFGMAVSSKSSTATATAEFRNLGDVLA